MHKRVYKTPGYTPRRSAATVARDAAFAAGLCALEMWAQPGVPYSQGEIARACRCSQQNIHQIEQRALKKLRLAAPGFVERGFFR